MQKIYKIHPAIGICRVGNSENFFVGPEIPGHPGVDIDSAGNETKIQKYKMNARIKRQAARFQVFEYQVLDDGTHEFVSAVDSTKVSWSVNLANTKASGKALQEILDEERNVLVPKGEFRNADIDEREDLNIRTGIQSITGRNKGPYLLDKGSFLGTKVSLGEIRTDSNANLIVVGGMGNSAGIPDENGEIPKLKSYSDNDGWYDDVSDGIISAKITDSDDDILSAWVICGPPDFAPAAHSPSSIYDFTIQAAIERGWKKSPQQPSFTKDILPILQRSSTMQWVHDATPWDDITDDWGYWSDKQNIEDFERIYDIITDGDENGLREYGIPSYLKEILSRWKAGNFINDYGQGQASLSPPEELDKAALTNCIATSFYPGIEVGFSITDPSLYIETGRLSPDVITPGDMTSQMALPWQADFNDCSDGWWPSQRPNSIYEKPSDYPYKPEDWAYAIFASGPPGRKRMVKDYWRLGFVVEGPDGTLVEEERDDTLPPRDLFG